MPSPLFASASILWRLVRPSLPLQSRPIISSPPSALLCFEAPGRIASVAFFAPPPRTLCSIFDFRSFSLPISALILRRRPAASGYDADHPQQLVALGGPFPSVLARARPALCAVLGLPPSLAPLASARRGSSFAPRPFSGSPSLTHPSGRRGRPTAFSKLGAR